MRTVLRTLPLALLLLLALGLVVAPVAGQDLLTYAAENCDYGGEILSIEAVDELTVKFTLCFPDPAFPSKVAFIPLGIQSSEYLEATGGGGDLLSAPIGTGPYMLENWDLGNEIVLSRFDDYWGTPAIEPTAIYRWAAEASTRLIELQAGNIDAMDNPAPGDIDVVRNDPNLQFFERVAATIFYVGMNRNIAPFDNDQVRQAMVYAIDRQRIVDNFFPAGSTAATDFIPPIIFGHTPEVEPFPFDPAMAEQLLDEAGFPRGDDGIRFSTTLSYRDVVRPYLPTPGIIAADVQAQLAEIGVAAEVVQVESGAFIDATVTNGELPMYLLGWTMDYPDATNFFDTHFGAGAGAQFGDKFDEITAAIAAGGQEADPEARYPHYVEVNTLLRDLAPMVPIGHAGSGMGYAGDIVGGHAVAVGQENVAIMEDPDDDNIIFMQNAEPISLYCADESDGESFRVCEQITEALLDYEIPSGAVIPGLAESYEVNDELTEWTFTLREGVLFHDGSALDSNDVVASYAAQWDTQHPQHTGRTATYTYFTSFFTSFLNPPPPES
jgi:peptide/nickel transport system substrate-binding protein